jgi:predicted DNA-binding transcriptional regulator YafY
MKLFLERSDEEHGLTIQEIIEHLESNEIKSESKSIYADIELLKEYGLDIESRKGKYNEYFVANRLFETPELKLLVDAVQSSRFITLKKSQNLIRKIESLTSIYEAKKLSRQVFVVNRVKTQNENIFYNVDKIYEAIAQNRKISFQYFEFTVDKEQRFRNNGDHYVVSPYALCWDDDNYYLISNYPKHDGLTHFRVDKMQNLDILEQTRVLYDDEANFNVADYQRKIFSMFGGTEISITLEMEHSLINVAIDRFGKDVFVHAKTDTTFRITVKVAVSPAFLSWIFQFGKKVIIISPDFVVEDFKKMIANTLKNYH